ncbi:MAG: transporter [Flavipsychrobacter sp.]|nr:transporter [Flavipsychrobacter sp.]
MSKEVVIRAENISKLYQLGQVGTGTLSHDLKRWWARARGQEDPYLKIGVENDRTKKSDSDFAWALQDINFEVHQGDTLGIIGKNGAGKSTLLKVLSRVTAPTQGQIKIKGRIASLLEVGTGFHPELTGKENIYMNGAILGMSKREISRKFDEIVDFAGVELYINTPVKRYSSGMYVRLAFAVAAHLEPEILIVDEVLAVGDAEFQKKCLGKMGDVASHGRTIIFVSHNMQAVQSLCKSAIYLKSGRLADAGQTDKVINNYLAREIKNCLVKSWTEAEAAGNDVVSLLHAEIAPQLSDPSDQILVTTPIDIIFRFRLHKDMHLNLSLLLFTASGNCIFNVVTTPKDVKAGYHESVLKIPRQLLNDDIYTINLLFVKDASVVIYSLEDLLTFEVSDIVRDGNWYGKWLGAVRPDLDFSLT